MTKGAPRHAADLIGAQWLECGDYWVTHHLGQMWCRPKTSVRLGPVPKKLRQDPVVLQLQTELNAQAQHQTAVQHWVQAWMLNHQYLPMDTLRALCADRVWQRTLYHLVVWPDPRSEPSLTLAGLPRGPLMWRGLDDMGRGLWLAASGTLAWAKVDGLSILHPLDLPDLALWQHWLARLGLHQGVAQLERECFSHASAPLPTSHEPKLSLSPEALKQVVLAEGWQWQGGMVRLGVDLNPQPTWACVWVGPAAGRECQRGGLVWVDAHGQELPLDSLSAQAYSEGVRLYTRLAQAHTL